VRAQPDYAQVRYEWPDVRVGAMAYLVQGLSTAGNKPPRIKRIEALVLFAVTSDI
jgi:hypothetical protein